MTTHYDILGIGERATAEQIKRADYRRARAYHPDAHAGSTSAVIDEAERAMAGLNAAWNVLRDPTLRQEYDDALEAARWAADAAAGGRRNRRRRQDKDTPPPLTIGAGFSYWMGSSGVIRFGDTTRLSLAVRGTTDLEPLRRLAPDGLFALHAARVPVDDGQLLHLQGLTGLQVLDLTGTAITDAGVLHLQGLERLETLWLWDTAITDAGVALIGRLPGLRQLGLGNTRVTDAGLAGLAQLTNLRLLQLWGTDVVGHGLQHLHGLLDLEIVTLPWRVRGRHRRRLKRALPAAMVV